MVLDNTIPQNKELLIKSSREETGHALQTLECCNVCVKISLRYVSPVVHQEVFNQLTVITFQCLNCKTSRIKITKTESF